MGALLVSGINQGLSTFTLLINNLRHTVKKSSENKFAIYFI